MTAPQTAGVFLPVFITTVRFVRCRQNIPGNNRCNQQSRVGLLWEQAELYAVVETIPAAMLLYFSLHICFILCTHCFSSDVFMGGKRRASQASFNIHYFWDLPSPPAPLRDHRLPALESKVMSTTPTMHTMHNLIFSRPWQSMGTALNRLCVGQCSSMDTLHDLLRPSTSMPGCGRLVPVKGKFYGLTAGFYI